MTVTGNSIKSGFWRGLPKMEEYKAETEGLGIALTFRLSDGFCLGGWFKYHSNRFVNQRMDATERESFARLVGDAKLCLLAEWDVAEFFLKAYWERFGNMSLQFKYKNAEGFPLGKWVADTRRLGKRGELNTKQLAMLAKYGISIEYDMNEIQRTNFKDGISEFEAGYSSYKWLGVNKGTVSDSGYPLGAWLTHRISEMMNGSLGLANMITMARVGCLPQFSDESTYWYEGLNSLADTAKTTDVEKLPFDYVDSLGFRLGDWLCYMRDLHLNGKLGAVKQQKLMSLGVDISAPRSSDWSVGYLVLTMFAPKFVNTPISRDFVTDCGYPIGRWIESNIRRAVNERLTDDKIMSLKFVGQSWLAKYHYKWQVEASLVEQEMIKHPVRKMSTFDDERNGSMLKPVASRYDTLQSSVHRNTNLNRRVWSEGVRNLLEYQINYNQSAVPSTFACESGFPLGMWVSLVRSKANSRLLSVSRLWILDTLGLGLSKSEKDITLPRVGRVTTFPLEGWLKDRKRQSMKF